MKATFKQPRKQVKKCCYFNPSLDIRQEEAKTVKSVICKFTLWKKILQKMGKKQSCSNLLEMASKLIENVF